MISISGISKSFGGRRAVESLTLKIPKGCIFGLLGHNGAGKSSLIGMMLGQVLPDAGTITIRGHDVLRERRHALAHVGAIYETPAFYDYLNGERNLRVLADFSGDFEEQRLREVVEFVGLTGRIHDRVSTYSHGMRQRLALAQALLPRPELLILDEPTEGLDPEGIVDTRNIILRIHREWGITIVVSSHQLNEIEQLCSEVAVMQEGRLCFAGDWRARTGEHRRIVVRVDRQAEAETALKDAGLVNWTTANGQSTAELQQGRSIPEVARWLVERGFAVERIAAEEMKLEEFYLEQKREAAKGGSR